MPSRQSPKHLPALVRHIAYNLRGGFLVRPLIIALALGISGSVLSTLEVSYPRIDAVAPRWPFPSHSDSQVAQVILSGIATSVMTVVSIVFAILLMTLTLASMQFSPRILLSFSRDRVTQWTLGIFLGTFSYCISSLPAAHTFPRRTEPVFAVTGAMLLALVCVIWLLYFIHHISHAISVSHIVDNIARETEDTIVTVMPGRRNLNRPWREQPEATPSNGDHLDPGQVVSSKISGYIQYADLKKLCAIAKNHHVCVEVVRRVGHFVPQGGVLLTVSKTHRATPELAEELRLAFEIGPTRTLQQDLEFGVLQIVDIALRAISPAVNDPTTAITCVDQLSRILICFAEREPLEDVIYDPPGTPRVITPSLNLERLVDIAFEQIRVYAKGDFAVSMRLIRALSDVGFAVSDSSTRAHLAERGLRVVAGAETRLAAPELEELARRNEAFQRAMSSPA